MKKYTFSLYSSAGGYAITEDGHTMFVDDVVQRLNRLQFVETEFKRLEEENKKQKDVIK